MGKSEEWNGHIYRVSINKHVHEELHNELLHLPPSARAKRLLVLASMGLAVNQASALANQNQTSSPSHVKQIIQDDDLDEFFGQDEANNQEAQVVKNKLLGSLAK